MASQSSSLTFVAQHYNLVSLAFYLGYLVWEFPTVYISQKLRVRINTVSTPVYSLTVS